MRRYGLKPDAPDDRDQRFKLSWFSAAKYMPESMLPKERSLRESLPEQLDQGPYGTCTGHGTTEGMRFNLISNGLPDVALSRMFPYYLARLAEGDAGEDNGAQIRNVIKALAKYGTPAEQYWPYEASNLLARPTDNAYLSALKNRITDYQRLDVTTRAIKTALYVGKPIVIGVTLFPSFESEEVAKTGMVPIPSSHESDIGGHCMLMWGYGQHPGTFSVRNSWGAAWGDQGDCYLPEEYVTRFGRDFWVINS